MTPRVAILDYGCGNLASVANAVRKVGGEPWLCRDPVACVNAKPTHYILPGQGHFGTAIEMLISQGWLDFLRGPQGDYLRPNRPILGICLGMQLMCEGSEEAPGVKGLGWFPYTVKRLQAKRLPHVGWNDTTHYAATDIKGPMAGSVVTFAYPMGAFYFCHSYCVPDCDDSYTVTSYEGAVFTSRIKRDHLWATQFHPEKSGKAGLALLAEFLSL